MSLPSVPSDDAGLAPGRKPVVTAERAMVVSSHPAVTAVAVEVLRGGGTAVDAMLTAVPLQQVLEPQLSTIAGGFGMLHWDATSATGSYLNANPDRPAGGSTRAEASPDTSGERVGVPATVAGMRAAADRFGTRPWASYFAPAITAAEDGFAMYPQLATALTTAQSRIAAHRSGRERYFPDGNLPAVGRLFRQPQLAAALQRISQPDGAEWFQRGAFAERFAAAVRESGGTMTVADLDAYQPRWANPLRFRYAGHDVLATPLPDTGGLSCAYALGVLERTGIDQLESWLTSPRALALIARTQAEAETVVDRYGADPLARDVPVELLLSPQSLELTARLLDGSWPGADAASFASHTPDPPAAPATVGSNQLVIVDLAGSWVSVLHTGYGTDFGTGLVVDGVGVNAANLFPGTATGPGRRIVAPLASTLILRDGRPWLGLGTPGYPPPSITLVLLNVLGYGMGLAEAVEAPRFAFDADGPLAVETRIPQATLDGLADFGIGTRPLGDHHSATGRILAVMREQGGRLVGAVDSRGSGRAAGLP